MKRTVAGALGTGAITQANSVAFTVRQGDFKGGTKPSVTMSGLATGETFTIVSMADPADPQIVRNGVVTFDSSEGSVTLESAGQYGVFKSSTAADPDLILQNSI
jgi:hypothetical protein